MMFLATCALAALVMLGVTPAANAEVCTDTSNFAALMDAVDAAVPCLESSTSRGYVREAKRVVGSWLDGPCKRQFVALYIRRSLCGRTRDRFEVCCEQRKTRGRVAQAGQCRKGCATAARSVGEGCTEDGDCVATTTTTTTTLPPGDPTVLDFTSGTPGGTCGAFDDGAGTVIGRVSCGGVRLGGGPSIIPEGLAPAGAVSRFALSCAGSSCTVGPDGTAPPPNTGGPDCTTTGCRFGTPLPIPNPTFPPLATCLVNTWAEPASGTLDLTSGETALSIPLKSDVYLTGTASCPKCSGGGSPGSPGTGTCTAGARGGQPCTSTNPDGLTRDCLPLASTFIGAIPLVLSPATTGTHTASAATGQFCPEQTFSSAGCFGSARCRTITASGAPAGALTSGVEQAVTLASTFCIPTTGNGMVDGETTAIPGPGVASLTGTLTVR